jgi:hypothetical protein
MTPGEALSSNAGFAIEAVRRLAPAIAAAGGIGSVNASSLILGSGSAQALARDRAVVSAQPQGFDAVLVAFRESPLTGCTSVMDIALRDSGWNPLDPRQAGNHDGFSRYVANMMGTPFFNRPPGFTANTLDLRQFRDPPAMVRAIAGLLPDTGPVDQQRVTRSILDMAHNVFGSGGDSGSARATLFVQHAVSPTAAAILVNLYWCQVMMHFERHSSKSSVSVEVQSIFNVERTTLTFPTGNWAQYAEAVARRRLTDVETWLRQTAAPS